MMAGRITMSDVAREAGVSTMTVSRVVNEKGEISPATRHRVLAVIDRLGYRPSGIARGLATQRTGTLGFVVPDISNPFFSDIARGVEDEAYAAGYNVFLCNTEEDSDREKAILESLEEKRVDGLILCSSRLDAAELQAALERYPAAILINRRLDGTDTGVVLVDDELGSRLAVEHLLRSGHTQIGFLAGPAASRSGRLRAAGYRAPMHAAGLAPQPGWVRHCSADVDGGREAALDLLPDHPELTALLCYNDLVAVGALQACHELGLDVPGDVAIAGFDDIPLAALVTPALTTCRAPRYDLGAQATEMLLARIQGRTDQFQDVVLPPELVVRASAPDLQTVRKEEAIEQSV
ncbi:MAG TPA: LacI family DNA-binding transcriptional regulator [Anaerolineae bacterium]|nr:LacI family DNA-binding transcriptional regulator [Anaerolineae bacterium]